MVRKAFIILSVCAFAASATASAPLPKEIAKCAEWIKSTTKSPSSFSLQSYSGYGRVVTGEQLERNIIGQHKDMADPATGDTCIYMASISFDIQNGLGSAVREDATCTVLVRTGFDPKVAIAAKGDRIAWKDFSLSERRCSRPVLHKN